MKDQLPKNSAAEAAAKTWSAENEKQKPPMTAQEERGLKDAKARSGSGNESAASKETFPHRVDPPGKAGLANEMRPGRGTRAEDDGNRPLQKGATGKPSAQDQEPQGRNAPLIPRTPREQPAHSAAHEQERDTGVSGKSGGT